MFGSASHSLGSRTFKFGHAEAVNAQRNCFEITLAKNRRRCGIRALQRLNVLIGSHLFIYNYIVYA